MLEFFGLRDHLICLLGWLWIVDKIRRCGLVLCFEVRMYL